MIALPPLPAWQEFHPLVIHFPIVLLLVAPLFVLIGALVKPSKSRPYLVAGLILTALGTLAAFVAVQTGEATADLVERTADVAAVLERHSEMAETTLIVFPIATIVLAAIVFAPILLRRETTRRFSTVIPLLFVLAYGAAALLLVNTAHLGGRLVHELGTSPAVASAADAAVTPVTQSED